MIVLHCMIVPKSNIILLKQSLFPQASIFNNDISKRIWEFPKNLWNNKIEGIYFLITVAIISLKEWHVIIGLLMLEPNICHN